MTVTFDSDAKSIAYTSGNSTFNMTCNSIGGIFAVTDLNTSGLSYNGNAFTNIISFQPSGSPYGGNCPELNVWFLYNTSTGTNTVSWDKDAGTTIALASYSGIHTSQFETYNTYSSDTTGQEVSKSGSVSTSKGDAWAVGFILSTAQVGTVTSAGSGTTERVVQDTDYLSGPIAGIFDSNSNIASTSPYTLNVDFDHSGYITYAVVSVEGVRTGGNFIPFLNK